MGFPNRRFPNRRFPNRRFPNRREKFTNRRATEIDYAVLDFVGAHLKPQVYETTILDIPDYVMLFSYKALCGHIKHLEYDGRKLNGPSAPDCIIPALFGVDVVETCAITTEVDPRLWIGKFVEMFETAARGTDVVRSVTLIHTRLFEERPVRLADDLLGRPLCKEVPTPHNACVKEWSRVNHLIYGTTSTESAVAELFVFDNPNLAKKLELFAWTIEQVHCSAGISMHYAFLLRVVDM
ncbi:hypothetical protein AAVH_40070 [Aphelenchoides avenae]|nr:hypothetical protein AAVH_40070 [Aphelenchus avenae]